MKDQKNTRIMFTNTARCRDCYRCIRTCPVKAIKLHDGQAEVIQERCIHCGTCMRECPQKARQYRNDLVIARQLVNTSVPVAASIAPSFAGVYNTWQSRRLPSALRMLGITHVEETAVGAWHCARCTGLYINSQPGTRHIASACPAVVSWIEKYYSHLVDGLVPLLSPMQTHAALIRQRLGQDTHVIFIGPCVAKKHEKDLSCGSNRIDCALTFQELEQWMKDENVDLAACEESDFDRSPGKDSRMYAVEGGSLFTTSLAAASLDGKALAISGMENIQELLSAEIDEDLQFIEPLFCTDGCIGGPGVPGIRPRHGRKLDVLRYARSNPGFPDPEASPEIKTGFSKSGHVPDNKYPEDQIREVLEKTGKLAKENQLDCGACGYGSCRAQSIAVLEGIAEPEMCIPYMRRLAEQRSDRIMETSPNGILILNGELMIIQMNPAFRKMFMCSDMVLGRHVSYLMDPEPFERLRTGDEEVVETVERHSINNIVCSQICYSLPEERQYAGIFSDITKRTRNKSQLRQLQKDTINTGKELLELQIQAAQEMTRVLGENTARGEKLVSQLLELAGQKEKDQRQTEHEIWDTYTQK